MILLTGGAGFIGSVLLKELNKRGREDIIVVDRLRDTDKWLNLRGAKYVDYIHADDLFAGGGHDYLHNVSFIFHMGACSATTERDMDFLFENNVNFSKDLIALAIEEDIPIIYASSAATYGSGGRGYDDKSCEGLKPLNPYGYSKQLVDEWVTKLSQPPKHWFGVKFFNVFGPNEYHKGEMRSLVHKAFGQIHDQGFVKLFKSHREDFKDGEQLRDFVYVKDVVGAMLEMMKAEAAAHSGIYNLGTGQARSFRDLVGATFKALEKEEKIEFIDMPESIRDQYQYYTQANMDKFHSSFPNFKFMNLEDAVADYVKGHLSTDDPYY